MTNSPKYIPPIGTAGGFQLLPPYDTVVDSKERYVLKSIRTISDYLANNEDVNTSIYVKYNNGPAYEADLKADIEILGIQSDRGNWVYVPVNLVKCYPVTNGIPYRSISIVLPLQPLPVDTDFTDLLSQLSDVVRHNLGFDAPGVLVETSKVVLVSSQIDTETRSQRALVKDSINSYNQLLNINRQLILANQKVYALEDYVKTHPQ